MRAVVVAAEGDDVLRPARGLRVRRTQGDSACDTIRPRILNRGGARPACRAHLDKHAGHAAVGIGGIATQLAIIAAAPRAQPAVGRKRHAEIPARAERRGRHRRRRRRALPTPVVPDGMDGSIGGFRAQWELGASQGREPLSVTSIKGPAPRTLAGPARRGAAGPRRWRALGKLGSTARAWARPPWRRRGRGRARRGGPRPRCRGGPRRRRRRRASCRPPRPRWAPRCQFRRGWRHASAWMCVSPPTARLQTPTM